MQELFLAKRVIHFTENQICFECRKFQVSGAYPQGLPAYLNSDGNEPIEDHDRFAKSLRSQLQRREAESGIVK